MRTTPGLLVFIALMVSLLDTATAKECNLSDGTRGTVQIVLGFYSHSFEYSGFRPCDDEKSVWWLNFDAQKFPQIENELQKLGWRGYTIGNRRLFIKAEACITERGKYGHMGGYSRAAELIRVIDSHPETGNDCQHSHNKSIEADR